MVKVVSDKKKELTKFWFIVHHLLQTLRYWVKKNEHSKIDRAIDWQKRGETKDKCGSNDLGEK